MLLITYQRQLVTQDDSGGTAGEAGAPVTMYEPYSNAHLCTQQASANQISFDWQQKLKQKQVGTTSVLSSSQSLHICSGVMQQLVHWGCLQQHLCALTGNILRGQLKANVLVLSSHINSIGQLAENLVRGLSLQLPVCPVHSGLALEGPTRAPPSDLPVHRRVSHTLTSCQQQKGRGSPARYSSSLSKHVFVSTCWVIVSQQSMFALHQYFASPGTAFQCVIRSLSGRCTYFPWLHSQQRY